jgi:hypothetical protein
LRHITGRRGSTPDLRTRRHNYVRSVAESGIFELHLSSQHDTVASRGQSYDFTSVHRIRLHGHQRIDLYTSCHHSGQLSSKLAIGDTGIRAWAFGFERLG